MELLALLGWKRRSSTHTESELCQCAGDMTDWHCVRFGVIEAVLFSGIDCGLLVVSQHIMRVGTLSEAQDS